MAQIILLAGQVEADFLCNLLTPYGRSSNIQSCFDIDELRMTANEGDRLISFLSPHIVPTDILIKLNYNCYNFHPAPPSYPGYHPASFAIYNNCTTFGSTFHQMAKAVDTGEIIKTNSFEIEATWNYVDLSEKCFLSLIELFAELAPQLASHSYQFAGNGEKWNEGQYTKKAYDEKRRIQPDTPLNEIMRRFKAFEGIYSPLPN